MEAMQTDEQRGAAPPDRQESPDKPLETRVDGLPWADIGRDLDARGHATTGPLLTPGECAALIRSYGDEAGFRSRVVMARHGFGAGEYRYFDYALPPLVETLRRRAYPTLAAVANRWNAALGLADRFPADLAGMLARCHVAGQARPTPLLLKYGPGDYNCLHQDLYGQHVFPLQMTILLSDPKDFEGGEFVLVEQRPRTQSRAEVVRLAQGEAVAFAVRHRPATGTRGTYRVTLRHGVSRIRSGNRYALGIIFHDAL